MAASIEWRKPSIAISEMTDGIAFAEILDGDYRFAHYGLGMLFEIAQITSAKTCSVFLKYQRPDAIRTNTSTIAIAKPGQ